jgi:hypothetical protein
VIWESVSPNDRSFFDDAADRFARHPLLVGRRRATSDFRKRLVAGDRLNLVARTSRREASCCGLSVFDIFAIGERGATSTALIARCAGESSFVSRR